jgi:adenine specific DNA methylase Mod
MNKEQKFYKALQDVFIGAKIEGQGGFVNLMRIKSNYYRKIEDILKKDIEVALQSHPKFRDELFDKLYSFFNRYFTESGSIYFNSTPFHNNIYEKVYTDEKDVILFWKTQMLYYVKTDRIFRSLPVEFDGFKFYFDASKIESKKANEKRSLIFELDKVKEDGTIVFGVQYSERRTKTKQDEILKALKRKGIAITEEQLERAFRVFEKQSEVDFFINKNAKAFLQEQFKLWSYQYFWEGAKEWSSDRVNELQILKDIAFKIIDFISQFEDELVKIWNKPKFVKNSNYVITLDRIKNEEMIEKIINHKNIKEQIKEWQDLGIVDENFKVEDVCETDLTGKHLSKKYEHLPIDTKYFKDLEFEILSLFNDLDNQLDGWLIKSENYQALNTILPKFKENSPTGRAGVQTIYIDPPYNTGSDEFIYKDRYQHSSWLTMMENRLSFAKELMSKSGVITINIGDTIKTQVRINSTSRLQSLCNYIFDENNYIATFVRKSGTAPRQDIKHIANSHDYILCYAKNIDLVKINKKPADISRLKYKDEYFHQRGKFDLNQLDRGSIQYSDSLDYPIIIEKGEIIEIFDGKEFKRQPAPERIEIWPGGDPSDKRWIFRWSLPKVKWGIENGFIVFRKINEKWKAYYKEYELVDNEGNPRERTNPYDTLVLDFQNELGTSEIEDLFGKRLFEYPKPSDLIKYLLQITTDKTSIVLDFFAGSGTTAHAVMKLNKEDGGRRKFFLVEMADYFYDIIIPRIKKIAYSFNWKDGKPQDNDGIGVFFKYYELEQYEEALANTVYENHDLMIMGNKSPYEQYVFMKDEKMLKALEIDYEDNKVKVDLTKLYPNIDIAETLSNRTGKWIKRIEADKVWLEGMNKPIETKDLDYKLIKPLIWWE